MILYSLRFAQTVQETYAGGEAIMAHIFKLLKTSNVAVQVGADMEIASITFEELVSFASHSVPSPPTEKGEITGDLLDVRGLDLDHADTFDAAAMDEKAPEERRAQATVDNTDLLPAFSTDFELDLDMIGNVDLFNFVEEDWQTEFVTRMFVSEAHS